MMLFYLAAIVIGTLLGVLVGAILATKLNRLLGWQRNTTDRRVTDPTIF